MSDIHALLAIRKTAMDRPGDEGEFQLVVGTGKSFLITEIMVEKYPYLLNPEARLTLNFDDIYTLLCGYSIPHLDKALFVDKARLAIFRTNVLEFGIPLTDSEILMIQKDEFDEIKVISDYVISKGSGWRNQNATFSNKRKVKMFLTNLGVSFTSLFKLINPHDILDMLESGLVKDLVIKNWSLHAENSVLVFMKEFCDTFFRN